MMEGWGAQPGLAQTDQEEHVSPQSTVGQPGPWGERLSIGKLAIDVVGFAAAVEQILTFSRERRSLYVVTPNADHVVRAEHDAEFARIANGAALVLADGMPVVWASRVLGRPVPERVTGADLLPALCAGCAKRGGRVFLLGGLPGEAEQAAAKLTAAYPGLVIAGCYAPPFGFEHDQAECQRIVQLLNSADADLVFVGVGSPKQEKWINHWRGELRCGVLLGIGAAIAFAAGTVSRAPPLLQKLGLEWAYRLSQEPRRLAGRYARDLEFFAILAKTARSRRRGGR